MKNIKTLCALTAIVLFTACYNSNSSTSQEKSEETNTSAQGEEAHSGEHGKSESADYSTPGSGAGRHTDTTLQLGAPTHTDTTMHKDSAGHK